LNVGIFFSAPQNNISPENNIFFWQNSGKSSLLANKYFPVFKEQIQKYFYIAYVFL